jgi:hypothetical protein
LSAPENSSPKPTPLRLFLIELAAYSLLVVAYFLVVLRVLADPLAELFSSQLQLYAFASLGLIVVQAVLLDYIVGFLVNLLGLNR